MRYRGDHAGSERDLKMRKYQANRSIERQTSRQTKLRRAHHISLLEIAIVNSYCLCLSCVPTNSCISALNIQVELVIGVEPEDWLKL